MSFQRAYRQNCPNKGLRSRNDFDLLPLTRRCVVPPVPDWEHPHALSRHGQIWHAHQFSLLETGFYSQSSELGWVNRHFLGGRNDASCQIGIR